MQNEEKEKMYQKIRDSFEEFLVNADGSPIGNDAESVSLRLVNKKMIVVSDNLICLKLHGKSLDGKAIENNAISKFCEYRVQKLNLWIYFDMDKSSNNGVAINMLQ